MRSMDYGLCAETGKAMVFYVLHGMMFYSDYTFLDQVALTGLKILDTRLVQFVQILLFVVYYFSFYACD